MNNGKRQIIQLLNRRVIAQVTWMQCVQAGCFIASVLALVLGIWALVRLDLSVLQIVLGVLISSLVPLVFAGIGILLPTLAAAEDSQPE